MWQSVLVILIVALAGAGLIAGAVRRLRGRGGCSCCDQRDSCPAAKDNNGQG